MEQTRCAFCGGIKPAAQMVRGRTAFICHACVGDAIARSIAVRADVLGHELPEADVACAFCAKRAPASALVEGQGAAICAACLSRSYGLIAETLTLHHRQAVFADLEEGAIAGMLAAHFGGDAKAVISSSRTFPAYMRVDLDRALHELLSRPGVRCFGIRSVYEHGAVAYATLLQRGHAQTVTIAPLEYDEIDIGEDAPVRCLNRGLWLVPGPVAPHALLYSLDQQAGWKVEIVVPPGAAGDGIVASYFDALERALLAASSYRGKILSLERDGRMAGTRGPITVHRLAPVAREDVILPRPTLELLERNIFQFAAHRAELQAMGLPVKKGLLFYGPPGTGKTHTIRYLARALPGHTTLLLTAQQIVFIAEYMRLARLLSPSIVVIEDVDLIARNRDAMGSPHEELLLNTLLNEMDGLRDNAEIFFVLTTNRPEALEVALTARPGRIDQAIEFPLPDADGRRKLARLYGKGAPISEATLERVVERTDNVSAAFVKELMRRSAQYALQRGGRSEVTERDVDAALEELLFAGGRLNAALLGALGARPERQPG